MERTIDFGDVQGAVSLTSPVLRYPANPVLTPADVNRVWRDPGLQVVTVHNAGAAIVGDETALLFRSHLRCGMSILGVARSRDGVTDWRVDPRPALVPATLKDSFGLAVSADDMVDMESGGVEDARLNPIDGTIAVTYSAYHARVRNRVQGRLGDHRRPAQFLPPGADAGPRHAQRGHLPRALRRALHRPVPPER